MRHWAQLRADTQILDSDMSDHRRTWFHWMQQTNDSFNLRNLIFLQSCFYSQYENKSTYLLLCLRFISINSMRELQRCNELAHTHTHTFHTIFCSKWQWSANDSGISTIRESVSPKTKTTNGTDERTNDDWLANRTCSRVYSFGLNAPSHNTTDPSMMALLMLLFFSLLRYFSFFSSC